MTTPAFQKIEEVPGSYGWFAIGWIWGLIDFFLVRGWSRFFTQRQQRYGSDIFKIRLFKPMIAVLDAKAIQTLFIDKSIAQDNGFGWAVPNAALIGGILPSIFMPGPKHDQYKALYLKILCLRREELIATFDEMADRFGSRWTEQSSLSFQKEIEDFTSTLLFKWYWDFVPDPAQVRELYLNLFSHVFEPITCHIPQSKYRRSLATFKDLLLRVKSSHRFKELLPLAHKLGLCDNEETAKQLLFFTGMNSFLGIQNLIKSVVGELSIRTKLAKNLRDEIGSVTASRSVTSLSELSSDNMPLLDKTLREILRMHPPVTFIFGRVQSDRHLQTLDGRVYGLRTGDLLMGVLPLAMHDARIFPRPENFDPYRFKNPSASEHLIWARGGHDSLVSADDRTCPGKDLAVLLAKLVCVWLLPRYQWTLAKAPKWGYKLFQLNVAAPMGPMTTNDFQSRPKG